LVRRWETCPALLIEQQESGLRGIFDTLLPAFAHGESPMPTLNLDEVQSHLREIVSRLQPGEEVVLTDNGRPVATLRATPLPAREPPRLGTLHGTILHIAPDFDDIPEGFEEYLP
jgi:antitoxin (DNA-binding transcriptional repressor) of toxin-antitoxin stability system